MDTTVYLRIPPPIQQIVTIGFYVGFKGCTHHCCKKAWLLNKWYLEPLSKWILQARTSTVTGFGSCSYEAQLLSQISHWCYSSQVHRSAMSASATKKHGISSLTAYTYLLAGLHRFTMIYLYLLYLSVVLLEHHGWKQLESRVVQGIILVGGLAGCWWTSQES